MSIKTETTNKVHIERSNLNNQNRKKLTKVISFTSGKGGVGKSNTVVNTGVALANLGRKVLIFDADLNLANIDILLGATPIYTIEHVLSGEKKIEDIIIDTEYGVSILPASSGIESLNRLNNFQRQHILESIESCVKEYDFLLIDTQAGIGDDVLYFNSISSEIVCVITPEPTSLTDSYALIKILGKHYGEKSISIIVNNVMSDLDGKKVFNRFSRVAEKYLKLNLKHIGTVCFDKNLRESVIHRKPVVSMFPSSSASICLGRIADTINNSFFENRVKGGLQFLFRNLVEMESHKEI